MASSLRILFALTVVPVLFATASAAESAAPASPAPAAGDVAARNETLTGTLRPADRTFLRESVENARVQAELARFAVSQATSSALRELAQQFVTDYGTFSVSIENLARRKAVTLPVQPVSFADRTRVMAGNSGSAFDHAFIQAATAASQHALRLCEAAVAQAKDPDVVALAGSLLPVVREHVNRLIELEKEL